MSFEEFLLANGDENLHKYLNSIEEVSAMPDAFFETPSLCACLFAIFRLTENVLNVPLFLADKLDKLIGIALKD